MSNHHPRPTLPPEATVDEARRYIRALVRWVGTGFHPDTDFHDYVRGDSGQRSFEARDADALNADLDRAIRAMNAAGIDPVEIALPVQRRLLRQMGVR